MQITTGCLKSLRPSQLHLCSMAKKKQATPLSAHAIAALRAAEFSGNTFRLTIENLPCYTEIKALVEALGGKWVAKSRLHVFPEGVDAAALVLSCCNRGEIPPSNTNDFYPTPAAIVEAMISDDDFATRWNAHETCAGLDGRPMRYLEPSGGTGALVGIMAARMRPQDELVIVELNPLLADGLRRRFPRAQVVEMDFLQFQSAQQFDVVLMNPPFAGKLYQKHVEHAFSMLRRLGILAAVVPSGFRDDRDFVLWAHTRGESTDLGAKKFEGTGVSTSLLWLENDFGWRDEPRDGYSSVHVWELHLSISTDGEALDQLAAANSFEEKLSYLRGYAHLQNRSGSAIKVNESIARELLASLVDYLPHNDEESTEPEQRAVNSMAAEDNAEVAPAGSIEAGQLAFELTI
jgi:hypothetical protein